MYTIHNQTLRWLALAALFFLLIGTPSGFGHLSAMVSASVSATAMKAVPAAVAVATFAPNCTTPQTAFQLGGTVCAQVTGINPPIANARFDFVDPDGIIQQQGPNITADGQTATFTIPASGPNAKSGTWKVNIAYNSDSSVIATTNFTIAACPIITLNPPALPNATAGASYGQTITASPAGSYTFTVTGGATPPGLTLNSNGTWSGAPTAPGSYSFTVTAQEASGCTGSQGYTLMVVCPTVVLAPATLPGTPAGSPYSQQLSVTAGGSYTFSLTSGLLPMGLSLSSGGLISGTPTQSGSFSFRVTATGYGSCTGFLDYTLVVGCTAIDLTPASLPGGSVGTAYSQTVSGTPSGTYSYTVTSGALPTGLALNAASGQIAGTPTVNGSYGFTITATAGACTGSRNYSVAIGCPAISFTTTSPLPAGSASVAYSQTLNVTPAGSYTFSITAGGLPSGLTLNTSTGVISGTPSVPGTYNFSVQAMATSGCTATQSYLLVIACPTITLSALATPTLNTAYNQTVSASPAGSYTFAVTAGALPIGLSLNPATGVVSGTPTVAGAYSFTITATGFGSCTGNRTYSGTIIGGGCPTITLAALPSGTVGMAYTNYASASPAGTYSYAVTGGSLPPGLTLYVNGLVFGYPMVAGTYNFTVTATDASSCMGTRSYTVVIN
ncbi:MAG: Ig domain-containing protein [Acidobacteriota bacterium]